MYLVAFKMFSKIFKNGFTTAETIKNQPSYILDILIIACIVGVFLSLFGSRKWGPKLTLGSIGIGVLWKVITNV